MNVEKLTNSYCKLCGNTGWRVIEEEPIVKVGNCECKKRRMEINRMATVLEDWPKYKDAQLPGFKPRNAGQTKVIEILRADPNKSLLLTGYFSRGKTHLMIAQYRYLTLTGRHCLLRSAKELIDELYKASLPAANDREVFESPILKMLTQQKGAHLFIDDIEKVPARTNFRGEIVFDLFDTIARRQQSITMTSNLPLIATDPDKPEDLRGSLGEAVVARIDNLCTEVVL
jgi:DNA replication protein DnaC